MVEAVASSDIAFLCFHCNMAARYRRVPTSEDEKEQEESKKERANRIENISVKIHSLFWVLSAIFLVWFLEIQDLIFSSKLNRLFFNT